MSKIRLCLRNAYLISRLDKPKPILLLFLPCTWGLFLAYQPGISTKAVIIAFFVFLFGAIAGRSFGCIVNDLADRDIDSKVERTKNRLIASGKVGTAFALFVALIWLAIGLIAFLTFNKISRIFILIGLCLAIIYPFSKRFMKKPQYILGLAFNLGVFVAYSAVYRTINNAVMLLYMAGIYWTLFYDTIYAMQDFEEDKKLGINSTAIAYEGKISSHLSRCIVMITGLIAIVGIWYHMPWHYYVILASNTLVMASIMKDVLKKGNFQAAFEKNIYVGMLIAIQILFGKIFYG